MEENGSCAAKDYLRDYYGILDDMIYGMTKAPRTDSISRNFIVQLLPHSRAGIAMSERLLICSDYLPLRDIAQNIIREGKKRIGETERMLRHSSREKNPCGELCLYEDNFRRITELMFREMRCAEVVERINCDFIREMIPHLRGAVHMAENALDFDVFPPLRSVLKDIVRTDTRTASQLQRILCAIDC